MSGDYSRKRFDKQEHYSAVQLQQGRVLLDSDWNEQSDILQHRIQTGSVDIIGKSGVPKNSGGFEVSISSSGDDLILSTGKLYLDGIQCELEMGPVPVSYLNQPHYPEPDKSYFIESLPASPPASPPSGSWLIGIKDGTYIVYLDVWQREVNSIDDPHIKESALSEADTSTRLQVIWQAKLLEVTPPAAEVASNDEFIEWKDKITAPTGKINARTVKAELGDDPCLSDSISGYRHLENQLYRIEIHKSGNRDEAKFKWSRENASVQTKIVEVDSSIIKVADLGKDDVLGFKPGNWVEIIDEAVGLNTATKSLFKIDSISEETSEISLNSSAEEYKGKEKLKLCRWDQKGVKAKTEGIAMTSRWMKIEDGLEIRFSHGNYKDGDYWLIPARTAKGEIEWPPYEIPNSNPIAQSPKGIDHHYCKLALLEVNAGIGTLTDCRKDFPQLSQLEAEDILYDNSHCNLKDVDNIQEAIDMLCAVQDLRDHNKFIHGNGVVCGLKVICGPNRSEVVVEKGYALDCEGNVILVKKQNELLYNIISAAAAKDLVDENGDGQVSIAITDCTASGPDLEIEKFVKKDFWDEVLEGTLIKDYYDDCIQSIIDFVKKNFSLKLSTQAPLPLTQKRLTTMLNLMMQYVNSATLPYSFVSGKMEKSPDRIECDKEDVVGKYEHNILWCTYTELRKLLDSETHCAIFDGDALFPAYEIEDGLHTIFGPALKAHYKIKLHPNGHVAYTCGYDNKIFVYDLVSQEYIQGAEFPASTDIIVQDFVIANDGKELFALGLLDDKDSIFAAAKLDDKGLIKWGKTSVRCGEVYHTLAINSSNQIYCIKINAGLFEIKSIGSADFTITQIRSFNATGMLILSDDDKYAFAAELSPGGSVSSNFSHISKFDLSDETVLKTQFPFVGNDLTNDIVIYDNILYISGYILGNPNQRILGGYNLETESTIPKVDLPTDWLVRLQPMEKEGEKYMLITQCDSCKVLRVRLGATPELDKAFRIPTQLLPMGIAAHSKSQKVYVVNFLLNTLTDIDINATFDTDPQPEYTFEPPTIIADYRDGVIDAYRYLLSHSLEHLKDCFADKFIIDCPECGKEDKIYLASVEIKNRKVYNINNFSKRKYIKTPELWEYWLSTVPILPIFKEKLKEFLGKII